MTTSLIHVATLSDLADGQGKALCLRGQPILLCQSEGTVHAVANECSHAFQALDGGRIMHGWVACPAHGARFDLASGEALGPPASAPIQTYRVIIDGGEVYLDLSGIA